MKQKKKKEEANHMQLILLGIQSKQYIFYKEYLFNWAIQSFSQDYYLGSQIIHKVR